MIGRTLFAKKIPDQAIPPPLLFRLKKIKIPLKAVGYLHNKKILLAW